MADLTAGKVPVASAATQVIDGIIADDASTVTVAGDFAVTGDAAVTGDLGVTGSAATGALTVTGNAVVTGYTDQSMGNALTAIGSDRAGSLGLTKAINRVTTATSGTGVTLPAVSAVGVGGSVIIFNAGASLIQVYGAGSDTIDGAAATVGVPLTNAKRCVYIAVAAATWISAQLGVVSA